MSASRPHFPPAALTFLRALTRHNDREWFREHKPRFERDVRAPMVAVIEALDRDFRTFAPELEASPARSIYRMHRDTRFSGDKTPLKTHIAAVFPVRGLDKNQGPGLYLEVSPRGVLVAGGLYAPLPADLLAVRTHLADNHNHFRSLVEAPGFKRHSGGLQGERLSRVPRGFPREHPAAEYLRYRQFLVWREFPADLATTPAFYGAVLQVFKHAAPLVRFLAQPLLARRHPASLPRAGVNR